jgi:hypothetical protein
MGQSRSFESYLMSRMTDLCLVQPLSLWRICKSARIVRLSFLMTRLSNNADVRTVTASELERLKKRFMKLDRCSNTDLR